MIATDSPPVNEEALFLTGMYTVMGEEYVAHAGVKGMKWGVRKAKDTYREQTSPQHKQRNERIVKAAIAVGIVAVGAILLKRGGVRLTTPASKKISLAGAKMSLNILKKSGKLVATTSVKVGSTAGKVAVKGTAKVGTLVGKGAYKGAIAGGKATGRAIAQNGSKFYEKGIKGAGRGLAKVGSHAMYKFTGRGKPVVDKIAKRSFNLSPTDLLLNTRADKWMGR